MLMQSNETHEMSTPANPPWSDLNEIGTYSGSTAHATSIHQDSVLYNGNADKVSFLSEPGRFTGGERSVSVVRQE